MRRRVRGSRTRIHPRTPRPGARSSSDSGGRWPRRFSCGFLRGFLRAALRGPFAERRVQPLAAFHRMLVEELPRTISVAGCNRVDYFRVLACRDRNAVGSTRKRLATVEVQRGHEAPVSRKQRAIAAELGEALVKTHVQRI